MTGSVRAHRLSGVALPLVVSALVGACSSFDSSDGAALDGGAPETGAVEAGAAEAGAAEAGGGPFSIPCGRPPDASAALFCASHDARFCCDPAYEMTCVASASKCTSTVIFEC